MYSLGFANRNSWDSCHSVCEILSVVCFAYVRGCMKRAHFVHFWMPIFKMTCFSAKVHSLNKTWRCFAGSIDFFFMLEMGPFLYSFMYIVYMQYESYQWTLLQYSVIYTLWYYSVRNWTVHFQKNSYHAVPVCVTPKPPYVSPDWEHSHSNGIVSVCPKQLFLVFVVWFS